MAWRKEVELRAFRKVFRIPEIVDLDKIKARFEDDDKTLTITMPKRVKGMSGFKIEEEEEEEIVDYRDVSEVENREDIVNGEEDEEIQKDKERQSQVCEGEEKGFNGGLDEEEETEDDNIEKIHQIDEKEKILECIEEEELADSSEESEDSSCIRKLSDIKEQDNNNELVEKQVSEEETKSDDIESREFEEQETEMRDQQVSQEEANLADDDGDLRKVQGIKEPERENEESQIHEMVEEETSDQEKKKTVMMEVKNKDAKEDVDTEMRDEFTPNIEEFEYDKLESDELVEENGKVRIKSEDRSLIKLNETEEQHPKGQKQQEKTPKEETNIGKDITKPVQEIEVPDVDTLRKTCNEGKEKKKTLTTETKNGYPKEFDAEKGKGFAPNISETEEFEFDKLEAAEVDKIHELVEKEEDEEENSKVRTQSEDISLPHENMKELMEEEISEAERNIENDTPKPVKERCEGKHKIQKQFQEEANNQGEEYEEKIVDADKKIEDSGARKVQEIRQQELEEPTRYDKQNKKNDEKEIAETETKDQESYRPKILMEQEKIQELLEEKTKNGKNREEEKIAEKKTEFGDENISRNARDSDAKEVFDAEMGKGFTPNIAETETKAEEIESGEVDKINELVKKKEEEDKISKVRRQSEDNSSIKKLQETEEQQFQGQKRHNKHEKSRAAETNIANEISKPFQEIEEPKVDTLGIFEDKEIEKTEAEEQESSRRKILGEQDTSQELAQEKGNISKHRKFKEKEEIAENKTELSDDDFSRKVGDIEQRDSESMKGQEENVCHGGKKIIAMAETISEKNKLRKAQEIEDTCGKKVQNLTEGEISGRGEAEDAKNKKKTTEEDKRTKESMREVQEIEKGTAIQEQQENRETYRNEQEEDKKDETDRLENITGTKEKEPETKTDDDVVRTVQGIKEHESSEPQREHGTKIRELVEEKTDDHEKEEENKIAKSEIEAECSEEQELHEPKTHKEHDKTRITESEEEEKEKTVASETTSENDNSSMDGQEVLEERCDKLESHEKQEEKIKVNEELETEEESSKNVQGNEKEDNDESNRSMAQHMIQETEEKDTSRANDEKEIVERSKKARDGSLRKDRDAKEPESSKPYRKRDEDKIQELVEMETTDCNEKVKKQDEDNILRSQEVGKLDGKLEADCSDKFHEFQKQKSYEEMENLVKEEATDPKDKHRGGKGEHEEERNEKVSQTKTKVEDEINKKVLENKKQEEHIMDDFQKIENEESQESVIQEKLDIVQDFVEDETGDQEDEKAAESEAVIANYDDIKLQKKKEQELEEHKEQNKIPETSGPKMKEEDSNIVAENKTKEKEVHVQELERKTENWEDGNGEGRNGEKGKQTKSEDGIVRKIREAKVQESNKKKDKEPEGDIEELQRKETSNHEVKLVTQDDSLRKGQEFLENESPNVSKTRPLDHETIQEQKEVEKREDEEKAETETKENGGKSRKVESDELEEIKELNKIQKSMEKKTNVPDKEKQGNEKIAEEEMQDKFNNRINDKEIKGQEAYELLKNGEHDKILEPIFEGTKYQREEEKGMEKREFPEMKGAAEDVSSREKHEIPEKQNIQAMNEERRYKAAPKMKSMEDLSKCQDVEGKRLEREQELMVKEEEKEEYDNDKREQKDKTERIPQVETKANDDSSRKNEIEEQESARLRVQKKREPRDQRKEEREEIVRTAKTEAECDLSSKIQGNKEHAIDKLERHGRQEIIEKHEKTSNHKEGKERNRAMAEDQVSENKDQEMKNIDDSSSKIIENEKQNISEEQDKNLRLFGEKTNDCRDQKSTKGDKEITEAHNPKKTEAA